MTGSTATSPVRIVAWIATAALLCACAAPPPRPAPSVVPRAMQPSARPSSGDDTRREYLPPSADAAEVEITETPAGAPAAPTPEGTRDSDPSTPAATTPASRSGDRAYSEGGRMLGTPDTAPRPAGRGATPPAGHRTRASGPDAAADPDLKGAEIHIGGAQSEVLRESLLRGQPAGDAGNGSPSGAPDGHGSRTDLTPEERGAGGGAATSTGAGNTPDLAGEERPAEAPLENVVAPAPAVLPAEKDEEIVARQIREAAQKETDPVLREKLWQEYRRYRGGLRAP